MRHEPPEHIGTNALTQTCGHPPRREETVDVSLDCEPILTHFRPQCTPQEAVAATGHARPATTRAVIPPRTPTHAHPVCSTLRWQFAHHFLRLVAGGDDGRSTHPPNNTSQTTECDRHSPTFHPAIGCRCPHPQGQAGQLNAVVRRCARTSYFTGWASGNFQVPSRISFRGRYIRTR